MVMLTARPSLVEQAYEAMLGDIADGTLAPNTRLVQDLLATRYGVSRQPILQALLLLKSDGIVQDAGRRGMIVAPLDLQIMRDRYEIRSALDVLAARLAAQRCAAAPEFAERTRREGARIIAAGFQAVSTGAFKAMIAYDVEFHAFVYGASGNPLIAPTAQGHWRFLRRIMGEVLRTSEPPPSIWQQHHEILDAIVAGDVTMAEDRVRRHIESAATRLAKNTRQANKHSREEEAAHGHADEGDRSRAN